MDVRQADLLEGEEEEEEEEVAARGERGEEKERGALEIGSG